jgi:hypothetical protein
MSLNAQPAARKEHGAKKTFALAAHQPILSYYIQEELQ